MGRPRRGRPTKYSEALAAQICQQLAQGQSLRTVCRPDDMPSMVSVFTWFNKYPEFLNQYTRAKEESADAMAEDILDISDNGVNDYMAYYDDQGEVAGWKVNGDAIQRSKLRVDTRKWLMAKMKPKKYGNQLDVTSDGKALPAPIISLADTDTTSD